MEEQFPTSLKTLQNETILNLLVQESGPQEIRMKFLEPYAGNLKSNKAKVAEGKMTLAEFQHLRSGSSKAVTHGAFQLVVSEKLCNLELQKLRAGNWIRNDPHLPEIREALARELRDKLTVLLV